MCELHSKLIRDFKIKSDSLDLIEDKLGKRLEVTGTDKGYLDRRAITQAL